MKLEIITGPDAGKKFKIPAYGSVTLGRGASCDITLGDKQCSREHGRITHTHDDSFMIEDLDSTNGIMVDHIKTVIKADTACLLVRNEADEWMIRSTSSDVTDLDEITISRTILEKALSQGAVLLCQDAQSDKRFDASKSIMRHGISSAICAPIKTGEEFTGVLFVDRRKRHKMFESMDVRFVATLANILGVLLEKEKLELAMRERERLATMGEVVAVVKKMVQEHGGDISVNSCHGEWTEFCVALPAAGR